MRSFRKTLKKKKSISKPPCSRRVKKTIDGKRRRSKSFKQQKKTIRSRKKRITCDDDNDDDDCPTCPTCPPPTVISVPTPYPVFAASLVTPDIEAEYTTKLNTIVAETRNEIANVTLLGEELERINDKDSLYTLLEKIKQSDKKVNQNISLIKEIANIFNKTIDITYDYVKYEELWKNAMIKLRTLNVGMPPSAEFQPLKIPSPKSSSKLSPKSSFKVSPKLNTPLISIDSIDVVEIVSMNSMTLQEKCDLLLTRIHYEKSINLGEKYELIYKQALKRKETLPYFNPELSIFQNIRDEFNIPQLTDEIILNMFPNPNPKITLAFDMSEYKNLKVPEITEKTKVELLQEEIRKVSNLIGISIVVPKAMIEKFNSSMTYKQFFQDIRTELGIADKLTDKIIGDLYRDDTIKLDLFYNIKEVKGNEIFMKRDTLGSIFAKDVRLLNTGINEVLTTLKQIKLETNEDKKKVEANVQILQSYREILINLLHSLMTMTKDETVMKYNIMTDEEVDNLQNIFKEPSQKAFALWVQSFIKDNSTLQPITSDGAKDFLALIQKGVNLTPAIKKPSEKIERAIEYLKQLLKTVTTKKKPYDLILKGIVDFNNNLVAYDSALSYYNQTLVNYRAIMIGMMNQRSIITYYNHPSFFYIYKLWNLLEPKLKVKDKDKVITEFFNDNIDIKNEIDWNYITERPDDSPPILKILQNFFMEHDVNEPSSSISKFVVDLQKYDEHIVTLNKNYQKVGFNDVPYLQTLKENWKSKAVVVNKSDAFYTLKFNGVNYQIPTSPEIEFVYNKDWSSIDDKSIIATHLETLKNTHPGIKLILKNVKYSSSEIPDDLQRLLRNHLPIKAKTYPININDKVDFQFILSDYFSSIREDEEFKIMESTVKETSAELLILVKKFMSNFLSDEKKRTADKYNHSIIVKNCEDFIALLEKNDNLKRFFNTSGTVYITPFRDASLEI
jgi:hypothetical protein